MTRSAPALDSELGERVGGGPERCVLVAGERVFPLSAEVCVCVGALLRRAALYISTLARLITSLLTYHQHVY